MTPSRPSRLSLVARFLFLGLFAFGAKRLLIGSTAERPLVVEVPEGANKAEQERALEEAMLLDVAERAGLPQADAVVRERVVRSLAVVEDVSDGNDAVARGLALGLHRKDPVARERLLADALELLFAARPPEPATEEETRDFLAAHADVYRAPARVQLRQRFLSRDKRGAALAADGVALLQQLASGALPAGDAWPWTNPDGQYSEARLDALVGPGFGAQVMKAPIGVWSGPIESSFGLHFVWVSEKTAPADVPLAAALPRARAELATQGRERARAAGLAALRSSYRVSWVTR